MSSKCPPSMRSLFLGDDDPRTRSLRVAAYMLERMYERGSLIAAFALASRLVSRLRQRVVVPPVPFVLPAWIVDPDFGLGYHLRFVTAPAPCRLCPTSCRSRWSDRSMARDRCGRRCWSMACIEAGWPS